MKLFKTEIKSAILEPKKESLIDGLTSVLNGMEKSYVPDIANPKYYEIWFHRRFNFNYVILGSENFTLDVSKKSDSDLLAEIIQKYNLSGEQFEGEVESILQKLEFDFFSKCWTEIENKLDKKVRCFLIEEGIIRGWDVNKLELIDGEDIGEILNAEGVTNNY